MRHPRHFLGKGRVRLLSAALLIAAAAGAAVFVSVISVRSPRASGSSFITPSVLKLAELPPSEQKPTSLAIAANGSAWFWSNQASGQTDLFRWDPLAGVLDSYDLGSTQTLGLTTGQLSAIAVAPNGTIWIGANRVVVSFSPQNETVSKLTLPPLPVAGALSALPSQYQGAQAIESMTVNAAGTLAIAVTNGNAVAILNTSSSQFHLIPLPQHSDATAVAYFGNGTLAVSVVSFAQSSPLGSILLVKPDGSTVVVPEIHTFGLTPDVTKVISDTTLQTIGGNGEVSRLGASAMIAATVDTMVPVPKRNLNAVAVTKSGYTAWISRSGVVLSSTTTYWLLKLPSTRCSGPILVRPTGGSSLAPTTRCAQVAMVIGSSPSVQGVYIIPALSSSIYFLPSGGL